LFKDYFSSHNLSSYRLKCHRYYENYGWYKGQEWHIDNKDGQSRILDGNKGLILIAYLDDVDDGASEYIPASHGKSKDLPSTANLENYFGNAELTKAKVRAVGKRGDVLFYDSSIVHRAGEINNPATVRRTIFCQIDSDLQNGEPMYLANYLVPNSVEGLTREEILTFLGIGLPVIQRKSFPQSNLEEFTKFQDRLKSLWNS
jgi:hypothetical protein